MARYPLTHPLADKGVMAVVCVVLESGEKPAHDFMAELASLRIKSDDGYSVTAKGKFSVLFAMMAKHGSLSAKRFKREMSGFSAFRHEIGNVQIRFPCFRDGDAWVVTHGFKKPGAKSKLGKWPSAEVKRAESIRATYEGRKSKANHGGKS